MPENIYDQVNLEGVTVVASSRSGATEVYRLNDGRLEEVNHLKSGRDLISEVAIIPDYLTIRYNPPKPAIGLVREFAD